MPDEIQLVKEKIAYQLYLETGNTDSTHNWEEATRILDHFLDRKLNTPEWHENERRFERYKNLIYIH